MSTNRIVPLREWKTPDGVLIQIILMIDGTISQEMDELIDKLVAGLGLAA